MRSVFELACTVFLLGNLLGLVFQTHGVLLQYLELLTSPAVIPAKDYAAKVLPSLAELGETYGICAPICMQIIRPMLHGTLLVSANFALYAEFVG